MMRSNLRCFRSVALMVCVVGSLSSAAVSLRAQTAPPAKAIAITIDDVPLNGQRLELARVQAMTNKLLAVIKSEQVPVVGFVNESLLYVPGETDARIALLRQWSEAGVELGNHTFAHVGFRDTPLASYEDDFVRGESVTRALLKEQGKRPRYFRHPFLQMGPTRDVELAFESFIAARGYQIAPVTIDILDWMFRVAYADARTRGDKELMKRVAEEYLKYAPLKFEFCEQASAQLFGRQISQIILLHANELNADNFERLLQLIKNRGYRFITLAEALKDPVYQYPDTYQPTSDWLGQWAAAKGKRFAAPEPPEFIRKLYEDNQNRTTVTQVKSN